ncbi:MAG: ACP S-malonyltransferase [Vampirovibrionales bacterium]|nr:ACP S-malonyltransferase [Vampirovibrionales bacterium]
MTSKIAFVFPGQGAQNVGMGQDFAASSQTAKRIFDGFDQALKTTNPSAQPISEVCFNGPEETLKQTLYTQPAILATSLAALALFEEKSDIRPDVTAGHSLGEYGALVASRVIDAETAARLIIKRASLMQEAPAGAMSAVLGLAQDKLEDVVKDLQAAHADAVIAVANFNTPDQIVITGSPTLLEEAALKLKEAGAKRVLPLPVGGAFHSPLMSPSAESFKTFLEETPELKSAFSDAVVPVINNVDAQATVVADELRLKLASQIDHSVCWTQTMAKMVEDLGVDTVIEFGPGKVLTGMFKKTHPSVTVYNVFDIASLEATLTALSAVAV